MTARNRGTSLIGKLSCYITYIIVIHRDIVTTTWTHATFCPKAGAELEYTDCLNWIMTPPFTEWLGVWQWSKIRQIKKNYDFTYCTQKLFRSNSFPFFLFLQVEWKWKKKLAVRFSFGEALCMAASHTCWKNPRTGAMEGLVHFNKDYLLKRWCLKTANTVVKFGTEKCDIHLKELIEIKMFLKVR